MKESETILIPKPSSHDEASVKEMFRQIQLRSERIANIPDQECQWISRVHR